MEEVSRQEIREVLEDALKRASIPFTESQLEAMTAGYFPAAPPQKIPSAKELVDALPDCRFKEKLSSGRTYITEIHNDVLSMVRSLQKAPALGSTEKKYWWGAEMALKGLQYPGSPARGSRYDGWCEARDMLLLSKHKENLPKAGN